MISTQQQTLFQTQLDQSPNTRHLWRSKCTPRVQLERGGFDGDQTTEIVWVWKLRAVSSRLPADGATIRYFTQKRTPRVVEHKGRSNQN